MLHKAPGYVGQGVFLSKAGFPNCKVEAVNRVACIQYQLVRRRSLAQGPVQADQGHRPPKRQQGSLASCQACVQFSFFHGSKSRLDSRLKIALHS